MKIFIKNKNNKDDCYDNDNDCQLPFEYLYKCTYLNRI